MNYHRFSNYQDSSHFQAFIDFHDWVDTNRVVGTDCLDVGDDGLGGSAEYIPFDALKQYWQCDRIFSILKSCSYETPILVSVDEIIQRYLLIFSILVYISTYKTTKLSYIQRFMVEDIDDSLLPFKTKPDALPNAVDGIQTFEQFRENQWLFSPVVLGPKRLQSKVLLPQSILPFTVDQVLSGTTGKRATAKKCNVHPSCGLPVSTIVLKEFDSSEIEGPFKKKVDSYISLTKKFRPEVYAEHILDCYGSFRKGDKAFIMLEFTNQGNLLDFLRRNELPLERHELYDLWISLSKLFTGLDNIHSLHQVSNNTNFATIRGVHQSLKPTNIFVLKLGDNTSYSYQFKIGGFEMSSIALFRSRSDSIRGRDSASTKMYGAPELTSHYSNPDGVDYNTLWEIDIWSMGCVLFEVLIWTVCGSRGLFEFFWMRQRDTANVSGHTPQGPSGCFHDGKTRLQAVDIMKDVVMQRTRIFDDLSDAIGNLILDDMLRPQTKRRLEAGILTSRFQDILEPRKGAPASLETAESQAEQIAAHRQGGWNGGTAETYGGGKGSESHNQAGGYPDSRVINDGEGQQHLMTDFRPYRGTR